jgi:hypothetical protein
MTTRILLIATAALAAAYAQPAPGRGRGPGGPPPRMGGGRAEVLGTEVGIPGRVVKNAPFSADIVTERTQVLPDGNRIKQSNTVRFYRDSEGRTRREQSLQNLNGLAPNANLSQVAFINDPVGGANYALNLEKRTATKTGSRGGFGRGAMEGRPADGQSTDAPRATSGDSRPASRGRSNPNLRTESLGRQIVEGVQADGTRTTLTIPAGEIGNENAIQVVTETWYSPELQTYVLRKRSDPRSGDSSTRYINISRAEPARILFEPPADFKLVEPRGMMRKQ